VAGPEGAATKECSETSSTQVVVDLEPSVRGLMAMSANTDVKTFGSRDSLRHLERVGLEVEPPPHALQEEGLNRQELFSFVRGLLERAPVQILSRTGALHLKGAPTLFLELSTSEREPGSYLYTVALELVQRVSLERLSNSDRFFAVPTWRAEAVGVVERKDLSSLRDVVSATADAFANALDAE
jgi:hypothetical protein